MLEKGEKLFFITRRLFEGDMCRHFVGEVVDVSGATVRVQGYAFVFDETSKEFVRREDLRTRIFSLIDAGNLINILPEKANLAEVRYMWDGKQRVLTDARSFKMNVSEFGTNR